MKRLAGLVLLITVVVSTVFFAESAAAQPRRRSTRRRTPPTTECHIDITGIADCPESGCGENGDSELNKAKNRTDTPSASAVRGLSIASMQALAQPASWNTGDDRTPIRGAGREGAAVELKGFVFKVKPEGGESCNCELTRRVDTDVHLALIAEPDDGEKASVTVEITPRVRANGHPDWLFKNIKDLEGEFIRVTGWLMLDTKHIRQSQRLPHERFNKPLTRATNWEVHPVTKLEVCQQSIAACNANHGWQEFSVQ